MILSIGTCGIESEVDSCCGCCWCCADITSEAPEMRASSPRPRPNFCLATGHHLLRKRAIRQGTGRSGIIVKDRLPEAGRFAQAHIATDDRLKRHLGKVIAYFAHNIACQPCAWIKHGEYNSRYHE